MNKVKRTFVNIAVAIVMVGAASNARAELNFPDALIAVLQGSNQMFNNSIKPALDNLQSQFRTYQQQVKNVLSIIGMDGIFGQEQNPDTMTLPQNGSDLSKNEHDDIVAARKACEAQQCPAATLQAKIEEIQTKWKRAEARNIDAGNVVTDKELASIMENDAYALNTIHKSVSSAGLRNLDPAQKTVIDEEIVAQVYSAAKTSANNPDKAALAKYLTPTRMLFPAVDPNFSSTVSILLDESRSEALVNVLMGATSTAIMTTEQLQKADGATAQLKLFTRFARLQLARTHIQDIYSRDNLLSIQDQYKKFVASPSGEDLQNGTYSMSQYMATMVRLQQGTNLELLMIRRQMFEQAELMAVILTATLEGQRDAALDQAISSPRDVVVQ